MCKPLTGNCDLCNRQVAVTDEVNRQVTVNRTGERAANRQVAVTIGRNFMEKINNETNIKIIGSKESQTAVTAAVGTKWTPEQSQAIHTSHCNLLVAAAAGSGKTAVLVERIIRKILNRENPVDIDKLLIVTFTNAAAAEMRERIGEAVTKELDKAPDSRQLQRQITLLNKANITTIHSFCLGVIKNNFHKLDIDPNFRIADATEAVLLKQEILQELFEERYDAEIGDKDNSIFLKLVDSFGGKRDDLPLQTIVLNLYDFVMSGPWPENWLRKAAENFNGGQIPIHNLEIHQWGQVLIHNLEIELEGIKSSLLKALKTIEKTEGLENYAGNFMNDTAMVEDLLKSCGGSWQKLYENFNSIEFARLKAAAKNADKNKAETVKKIRDEAKNKLKKLKDELFSISPQILIKSMTEMYPMMKCLTELVIDFKNSYSLKKKEKGLLDFNDLEHFCLKILTEKDEKGNIIPSETALKLRSGFEEILVDEYQDSNNVQEVIISMVSKWQRDVSLATCGAEIGTPSNASEEFPNVFMVGDVKQSIYRFRQAEPGLFLHKYRSYSQEEGKSHRKITLYKNFRSRKEVIDSVNFIFKNIMSENVGELHYDNDEALNLGAEFPPISQMHNSQIHNSEEHNVEKDNNQPDPWAVELHLIEKKMSEKISESEIDEDGSDSFENSGTGNYGGSGDNGFSGNYGSGDNLHSSFDGSIDGSGEGSNGLSKRFADEVQDLDNIQIEARVVGKRIKELITGGSQGNFKEKFHVYDRNLKAYRPAEFRDIVILMRATAGWAGVFMDELNELGIPVYADTGTGYFQTLEVQTMMSLLQIIDNPMQDIPLLSVLRSPIFAFTADELIDIRLMDKSIPFYEALKQRSEESSKVLAFFNALNKWRDAALHMPIDELIWYLYNETGYYAYAAAMVNGLQRQANLRILFQRAKQYEETSFKGLFNFINFINKLKKSSGDMGSAKILGENENVVRIMSIHKSKGLEFPVVILAGTGKNFNLSDMKRNILFHQEMGIGPDYVDAKRRITYPTIIKEALRKKIKLENLSEEMRVLYVALTRAKEKLIITGSVKDLEKNAVKWTSEIDPDLDSDSTNAKLPEYLVIKGKNYLDWICPTVAQHKNVSAIRNLAGIQETPDLNLNNDPSRWTIKLWKPEDLINMEDEDFLSREDSVWREDSASKEDTNSSKDMVSGEAAASEKKNNNFIFDKDPGPYSQIINDRLNWQYGHIEASRLPAKISVTELKRRINLLTEDEYTTSSFVTPLIKKPLFLEEEKAISSAERGTAIHTLMQHIDIKKEITTGSIKEQIQLLVKNEILSPEQGKAIRASKIIKFFNSDLGKRMLKSTEVKREVPFFIRLRSTEIYKELPTDKYSEEIIILQGIIDCYFIEEEELIIVDYKTDYVPEGGTEIIAERYKTQLSYYSKALWEMTGKNIKARYLYLFSIDKSIEI